MPVIDMGQAILGERIFALTFDRNANAMYGLIFPNAQFSEYYMAIRKNDI